MGAEIVFAPKNKEHARTVSEMLGDTTVKAKSHSRPKFDLKGGSTNTSETKRALLLPQEVRQIGKKRQIIFVENMNAILCEKVFYYKEKVFKKRLLPPHVQSVAEYTPPAARVAKPKPKPAKEEVTEVDGQLVKYVDREIVADDIETIDKLSLTDYNIDFEKIELPENEPATDEEMQELFGSFINSIAD